MRTARWRFLATAVAVLAALVPLTSVGQHATPGATPLGGDAWRVTDAVTLTLTGEASALSPDGAWLAGVGDDGRACVWAVPSAAATCAGDGLGIDENSFAWAPDSSAVAFSENAPVYLVDSDVMLLRPATGELVNLTEDGYAGNIFNPDLAPGQTLPVDTMPTWSPDGTRLAFSRVTIDRDGVGGAVSVIMTIDRAGGEPVAWATPGRAPWAVYAKMHWLGDGSLLYSYLPVDPDEVGAGVWRLEPDGKRLLILPGGRDDATPLPVVTGVAADERWIAVMSPPLAYGSPGGDPLAFVVIDLASPAPRPTPVTVPLPPGMVLNGPLAFAPTGTTLVAPAIDRDRGRRFLVTWAVGTPVAAVIAGDAAPAQPVWLGGIDWSTNDSLLVIDQNGERDDPVVLTIAPAD